MADNNFIPVFPPSGGNQARGRGRNNTGGRGSAKHASRSQNANAGNSGGGGGGGRGGDRRHYKPRGMSSGYADLANAMNDRSSQIDGHLDALREQMKNLKEEIAQKTEENEKRTKAYIKSKMMRGLRNLKAEHHSGYVAHSRSLTSRIIESFLLVFICFGLLAFTDLVIPDLAVIFILVQATAFVAAELAVHPVSVGEMLNTRWYQQVFSGTMALVIYFYILRNTVEPKMIPKIIPFDYTEGIIVPRLDYVKVDSNLPNMPAMYLLITPFVFYFYTVFIAAFSAAARRELKLIENSIFGWFIHGESVTVSVWNNPSPLFHDTDEGVDLRPQSQRHIKLTDAALKFRLDYSKIERTRYRFSYRNGPGSPDADFMIELPVRYSQKQLVASFGLLCELSDYDVCGLEESHKLAKERIKSRIRTIRSVNVDKYSAQNDNIYAHTALVALALWHSRQKQLEGLPSFD